MPSITLQVALNKRLNGSERDWNVHQLHAFINYFGHPSSNLLCCWTLQSDLCLCCRFYWCDLWDCRVFNCCFEDVTCSSIATIRNYKGYLDLWLLTFLDIAFMLSACICYQYSLSLSRPPDNDISETKLPTSNLFHRDLSYFIQSDNSMLHCTTHI